MEILSTPKSNHPTQISPKTLIISISSNLIVYNLLIYLHHKPKRLSLLMEDVIHQISNSISKMSIPQDEKIPEDLLQAAHETWNLDSSIIVTLMYGDDQPPGFVIKALRNVWHPLSKMEVVPRAINRYACSFEGPNDKARILQEQPWIVLKHIVLIEPYSFEMEVSNIVFKSLPVWTRFKGLDIEHYNSAVIAWIARKAGRVETVVPQGALPRGADGYRAKITLDVSKPIIFNTPANTTTRGDVMVEFDYCNLPKIMCERCKKLGRLRFKCPCPTKHNTIMIECSQAAEENVQLRIGPLVKGKEKVEGPRVMEKGGPSEAESGTNGNHSLTEVVEENEMPSLMVPDTIIEEIRAEPSKVFRPTPVRVPMSEMMFLPHEQTRDAGQRQEINQEEMGVNESPGVRLGSGGRRPRGRPRGSKTINRSDRNKGKGVEIGNQNLPAKKRRLEESSIPETQAFFIPENQLYFPKPTVTQAFSKLFEYLVSPLFATQVAQGYITPENLGSFGSQFNQLLQASSFTQPADELYQLGRQMSLNQSMRLAQEEGLTTQMVNNQSHVQQSGVENFITMDNFGVVEQRGLSAETIELTQSEYNFMRAVTTAQSQEQYAQETRTQTKEDAGELYLQLNGEGDTNGSN